MKQISPKTLLFIVLLKLNKNSTIQCQQANIIDIIIDSKLEIPDGTLSSFKIGTLKSLHSTNTNTGPTSFFLVENSHYPDNQLFKIRNCQNSDIYFENNENLEQANYIDKPSYHIKLRAFDNETSFEKDLQIFVNYNSANIPFYQIISIPEDLQGEAIIVDSLPIYHKINKTFQNYETDMNEVFEVISKTNSDDNSKQLIFKGEKPAKGVSSYSFNLTTSDSTGNILNTSKIVIKVQGKSLNPKDSWILNKIDSLPISILIVIIFISVFNYFIPAMFLFWKYSTFSKEDYDIFFKNLGFKSGMAVIFSPLLICIMLLCLYRISLKNMKKCFPTPGTAANSDKPDDDLTKLSPKTQIGVSLQKENNFRQDFEQGNESLNDTDNSRFQFNKQQKVTFQSNDQKNKTAEEETGYNIINEQLKRINPTNSEKDSINPVNKKKKKKSVFQKTDEKKNQKQSYSYNLDFENQKPGISEKFDGEELKKSLPECNFTIDDQDKGAVIFPKHFECDRPIAHKPDLAVKIFNDKTSPGVNIIDESAKEFESEKRNSLQPSSEKNLQGTTINQMSIIGNLKKKESEDESKSYTDKQIQNASRYKAMNSTGVENIYQNFWSAHRASDNQIKNQDLSKEKNRMPKKIKLGIYSPKFYIEHKKRMNGIMSIDMDIIKESIEEDCQSLEIVCDKKMLDVVDQATMGNLNCKVQEKNRGVKGNT